MYLHRDVIEQRKAQKQNVFIRSQSVIYGKSLCSIWVKRDTVTGKFGLKKKCLLKIMFWGVKLSDQHFWRLMGIKGCLSDSGESLKYSYHGGLVKYSMFEYLGVNFEDNVPFFETRSKQTLDHTSLCLNFIVLLVPLILFHFLLFVEIPLMGHERVQISVKAPGNWIMFSFYVRLLHEIYKIYLYLIRRSCFLFEFIWE